MIKKNEKTQISSKKKNELYELLINAHTDIVLKWNNDEIVMYVDEENVSITTVDNQYYHFKNWEDFLKAKLFNGCTFEEVCLEVEPRFS